MISDITMCASSNCPLSARCKRKKTSKGNQYKQDMAFFIYYESDEGTKCSHFLAKGGDK